MKIASLLKKLSPPALGVVLLVGSLHSFAQVPDRSDHWIYTVDQRNTLISIGKRFLKAPEDWVKLQQINGIANANRLVPGSKLQIPVALLRSDATVATVKASQGKNTVVRGATRLEALPPGTQLLPGDRVETGLQSTMMVEFADGSQVSISPLSKVVIEKLLVYGSTGVAETQLKIEEGAADSKVKPLTLAA